jgi:polyhydroxyalkanoate synthesis regulator phasin
MGTMLKTIRKALLTGVGAAVISTEKAEGVLRDFVQQGRVSAADAKAIARRLSKDGKREFAATLAVVEERVLEAAKKADAIAQARIAELEARVAAREKQQAKPKARKARRPKAEGA